MKIYTRTGDGGETSLRSGERVLKNEPRIEAEGVLDELNASLGIARATEPTQKCDSILHQIQNDLFVIGSLIERHAAQTSPAFSQKNIDFLESSIDDLDAELPELKNFILPGGTACAAQLHYARTLCRSAERTLIPLLPKLQLEIFAYINRLSDLLFVVARYENFKNNVSDIIWKS